MNKTLYQWTVDEFVDGPELFADAIQIMKGKALVTRDVSRLRRCSIGLITSTGPEEWYRVCRLNCEPSTIIEEYDDRWAKLYEDELAQVKVTLARTLLDERLKKGAKVLMEILERRTDEWKKDAKSLELNTDPENKKVQVIIKDF